MTDLRNSLYCSILLPANITIGYLFYNEIPVEMLRFLGARANYHQSLEGTK